MWGEVEKHFTSEEVKVIFSLVAFFLGSTPFQTPAIYSLLNYTEMKHNGYWKVKGGMYRLVEELVKILNEKGVKIVYNTEIISVGNNNGKLYELIDQNGKKWTADIFISNSDAASFRGKILKREKFSDEKLNQMHWTLAPFTIYLGVKGKIDKLGHHNYFLGNNFRGYADTIFTSSISPQKPYYYVNALSKSEVSCAPEGCENLFILCPVPDLRYKKSWEDKEELAKNIIDDLSKRVGFDIQSNIITKKILAPDDWANMLNLYKGSGLGLAHDINQVGAFRPKNKDEKLSNLYYVGASTTPGTGLPMVIISSKLVTERIENDFSTLH
jgi:phytoene desaturase